MPSSTPLSFTFDKYLVEAEIIDIAEIVLGANKWDDVDKDARRGLFDNK